MKVEIKKHGLDFTPSETNRPVKITLSNGIEFLLTEEQGMLAVNLTGGSINIKPQYGNQISLSKEGK